MRCVIQCTRDLILFFNNTAAIEKRRYTSPPLFAYWSTNRYRCLIFEHRFADGAIAAIDRLLFYAKSMQILIFNNRMRPADHNEINSPRCIYNRKDAFCFSCIVRTCVCNISNSRRQTFVVKLPITIPSFASLEIKRRMIQFRSLTINQSRFIGVVFNLWLFTLFRSPYAGEWNFAMVYFARSIAIITTAAPPRALLCKSTTNAADLSRFRASRARYPLSTPLVIYLLSSESLSDEFPLIYLESERRGSSPRPRFTGGDVDRRREIRSSERM